jgi:UDP-glucose 4-epimerase
MSLVTGGGGFIGSHLVAHLLQQGEQVVVLDDFSSGHLDNLRHVMKSEDLTVVRGSILDAELVDDLVGGCDLV